MKNTSTKKLSKNKNNLTDKLNFNKKSALKILKKDN